MGTKIEDFLKAKKIDRRRLLAVSARIEALQPEDRQKRLTKRIARKGEDAEAKKKAAELKPRTGKPVTDRALNAAFAGQQIAGGIKTRILRAVNALLEKKKESAIELSALFDNTARPKKEKKVTE